MLVVLGAALSLAPSELRLPSVFSENMVLQRGVRAPVFGTARPGQRVRVDFYGQRHESVADEEGRWKVSLEPLEAGGPFTMTVRGGQTIRIPKVFIGEVWVASGQSNMEWRVAWADEPERELFEVDPAIRMFTVGRRSAETPQPDIQGAWIPASKTSVFQFSAVAYEFAKRIYRKTRVPIGIIQSSWGGTPAESWVARERLAADPEFGPAVADYLAALPSFPERRAEYERRLEAHNRTVYKDDPGNKGYHLGYADPSFRADGWTPVSAPGSWESSQSLQIDGAVWLRRQVDLPDEWYGKELKLELGAIDDADHTYFNGHQVGHTSPDPKGSGQEARTYRIAPGLVRRGSNLIAVRVFDRFGEGGLVGAPSDMRLTLADGSDPTVVPLSGVWLQKIELRLEPAPPSVLNAMPVSPAGPGHPQAPGGLWNGMIAPFVPYAIRGAIWYQGESNAPRAAAYRRLFPQLIDDWRTRWGQGPFPFYFVQLANFRARRSEPSESDWAELREAQAMALKLPNTGLAVAIDIGDPNEIHPKNKREVGRRLALHALAREYGDPGLRTGPIFRNARPLGAEIQVFFDGVGQRLRTSDRGPLKGFAVAGADRKFVWATARISGSSVLVGSPRVPKPVAVRYAWADNPEANLSNSAGLPASPFRTDDWPGVTGR